MFYLLLLLLAFTSADIIIDNFLELHSILSVKKIFVMNFIFKQIHSTPRPLNGQNPLNVTKAFR